MKTIIPLIFAVLFFCLPLFAQKPIDAGKDTTIALCPQGCATLKATVNPIKATTDYKVESIPYAPDSFNVGTKLKLADDAVSSAIPLGFTFNFFGNDYTQFYIGSNGWIGFSAGQTTKANIVQIPDTSSKSPKNCIMLKWSDLGLFNSVYTDYVIYGTIPYRKLVVSYDSVLSLCSAHGLIPFSGQIILYETTNIIELFIKNTICAIPSQNDTIIQTGVQGLHNKPGTKSIVTPGKNNTTWLAFHDGIRYTPNGTSAYTVNWFKTDTAMINKIASDTTQVQVCPTTTTSYIAELVFSHAVVEHDTVVVSIAPVITKNRDTLISSPATTYQWNLDGHPISNATSQTYIATITGSYTVTTTINGCTNTSTPFIISGIAENEINNGLNIFSNPTSNTFTLSIETPTGKDVQIKVYNILGELVYSSTEKTNGKYSKEITLNKGAGIYFMQLQVGEKSYNKKLVILGEAK